MIAQFTCVESVFLFISTFTLEVVAIDVPLEVSAMKIGYRYLQELLDHTMYIICEMDNVQTPDMTYQVWVHLALKVL